MPVPTQPLHVRPALLRYTVHDRLRDAIVDGTLAPGEVVRDAELATWLGVSRTPVREALLRLADAGSYAPLPAGPPSSRRSTRPRSATPRRSSRACTAWRSPRRSSG